MTYIVYRHFDQAIETCNRVVHDDPVFAQSHACLAFAYWGKRVYPQVIGEFKTLGRLGGDEGEIEFASTLEEGFRSSAWKGALPRAARALVAMRKSRYVSPYAIAELYADLGDKEEAFRWLNTAREEHDDSFIDPEVGRYFEDQPRLPQLVEKRRLRLRLAWGKRPVRHANTHSRSEARAGGRPEKLSANRLL
jgi:hypothetical protein